MIQTYETIRGTKTRICSKCGEEILKSEYYYYTDPICRCCHALKKSRNIDNVYAAKVGKIANKMHQQLYVKAIEPTWLEIKLKYLKK